MTVPLFAIRTPWTVRALTLSQEEAQMTELAWKLGGAAGLMIILGYPGELIIEGDLSTR